jgi:hypothetical protein
MPRPPATRPPPIGQDVSTDLIGVQRTREPAATSQCRDSGAARSHGGWRAALSHSTVQPCCGIRLDGHEYCPGPRTVASGHERGAGAGRRRASSGLPGAQRSAVASSDVRPDPPLLTHTSTGEGLTEGVVRISQCWLPALPPAVSCRHRRELAFPVTTLATTHVTTCNTTAVTTPERAPPGRPRSARRGGYAHPQCAASGVYEVAEDAGLPVAPDQALDIRITAGPLDHGRAPLPTLVAELVMRAFAGQRARGGDLTDLLVSGLLERGFSPAGRLREAPRSAGAGPRSGFGCGEAGQLGDVLFGGAVGALVRVGDVPAADSCQRVQELVNGERGDVRQARAVPFSPQSFEDPTGSRPVGRDPVGSSRSSQSPPAAARQGLDGSGDVPSGQGSAR